MSSGFDIDAARRDLPVTDRLAYLNTGTAGPLPRRALAAMAEAGQVEGEAGRIGMDGFMQLFEQLDGLRRALAEFVGADPVEIGITTTRPRA